MKKFQSGFSINNLTPASKRKDLKNQSSTLCGVKTDFSINFT